MSLGIRATASTGGTATRALHMGNCCAKVPGAIEEVSCHSSPLTLCACVLVWQCCCPPQAEIEKEVEPEDNGHMKLGKERGCTDCLCLLLFILALGIAALIAIAAYQVRWLLYWKHEWRDCATELGSHGVRPRPCHATGSGAAILVH